MFFANKRKQQTILPIISLRIRKVFPLVRYVLRVHCVLRVYFTLIAGAPWEVRPCVEDSSSGHKRILISYRYMFILFPRFKLSHSELWYYNKWFLRLYVVWNRLSIVRLYSLLDPGCKIWIFRVLPLGVLDGTTRFSSLSGYLVSSGRQVPPKPY